MKPSSRVYKYNILNILLLFVCMTLLSAAVNYNSCSSKTVADKTRTGYIYTGDSRIRRLNLTIGMSKMKDNWVYCKSGKGYNWFEGDSLEKINNTMKEHAEIDQWVIVSAWGANDLWNLNTYLDKYKKLLYGEWKNCRLYLVSVNPVNGRMSGRYNGISSFNAMLRQFVDGNKKKSGNRVYYIDTNRKLSTEGFSTIDGLHYTERTNCLIYATIRQELDHTNAHMTYSSVDMNRESTHVISVKDINSMVNWEVDNKRVARITKVSGRYNQNVTITAKNAGTTTLVAKCGSIKLVCDINVTDKKVLVAYFSYYGNSELVAEYIRDYTSGRLVEIEPSNIYPLNGKKLMARIKNEYEADARPDIDNEGIDLTEYNDVYVGFPVWYGHVPGPILSFIDKCVTNGVTMNVFCTSEDGKAGGCIKELKDLYKECFIKHGVNIQNDMVLSGRTKGTIREWIDKIP